MNSTTERSNWELSREHASKLLDQRDYEGAIKALEEAVLHDSTADSCALMALACYQSEQYSQAVHYYEAAFKVRPEDDGLRDMLTKARANAEAEIHVHVQEIYYFDAEKLL